MNLLVGVPTINSYKYIYSSLERIKKEIDFCLNDWHVLFVVVLNGNDDNGKSEKEIERFFKKYRYLDHHFIVEKKEGKNNALNRILELAREMNNIDIVHFFDDDVKIYQKSLKVNVSALIELEKIHGKPVLVGSSFLAFRNNFSYFLKNYFLTSAIWKWLFHLTITYPYLMKSEKPRFCEGTSLGAFLKYLPSFPDDSLGVTDDSFLSNFFAVRGKIDYEKLGICPTFKPKNSHVYIKVPNNFHEWRNQQIRIHAGIERSFEYFKKDRVFLEKYFSWAYAFNLESRKKPEKVKWNEKIVYHIYMYLHERNREEAQRLIIKNIVPNWTIAHSTKS